MKRKLFIFMLIIPILILSGCAKEKYVKEKDEKIITIGKLLSGYPENVLPLYKAISIEDVSFTYRDDPNFIIGKDYNYVYYISNGNIDEISAYYMALMTSIDDINESWFNKYYPSGNIGDNRVNINFRELEDGSNNVAVSLTIGSKEADYVDKNPYFNNYPDVLDDLYRKTRLQDVVYKISYIYNKETYSSTFQTDMNEEEFLNYYKTKYESKNNFSTKVNDLGKYLMWAENDFDVSIRYNVSGNYKFIIISAEKSI